MRDFKIFLFVERAVCDIGTSSGGILSTFSQNMKGWGESLESFVRSAGLIRMGGGGGGAETFS